MASAASPSSSFLALRGVAEDLASARPAGAWTPVVKLRTVRGLSCAALAARPPSRQGSACDKKKKNRDEIGAPIPLPFDHLGAPSSSGGGGVYAWGKEAAVQTTGRRRGEQLPQLPPVSAERLDRWIRSSVTEIVKRVEEAPFLSFIFANDDSCSTATSSSSVRIEREVAEAEDWPSIQSRWGSTAPEGVILVEELKDQSVPAAGDQQKDVTKDIGGGGSGMGSAATRTWGVLVQGRGGGADCIACYILKTCRVRSAFGCCTHFCLVRAQCFGESAEQQLRDALLGYGHRNCRQHQQHE